MAAVLPGFPDISDTSADTSASTVPSPSSAPPSVLVLLAMRDGRQWIGEQLESIARQRAVSPSILASDDGSTDATPTLLRAHCPKARLLPPSPHPLGNACRNFLYLIETASIGTHAFVALADQDDIWFDDKLQRALALLEATGADCYSSNVIAFWPDGRQRLIHKSEPQRPFDFLFESAGPGCTFVMSRRAFCALQDWVRRKAGQLWELRAHDWLIYAFARQRQFKWVIDARPGMRYRQHARNQTGAHIGPRAAWARMRDVLSGRFRQDVLALARAIESDAPFLRALERFGLGDRARLLCLCRDFRRDAREAWLLGCLFLVMRRRTPPVHDARDRSQGFLAD
jgi:rhamnosyltransferase